MEYSAPSHSRSVPEPPLELIARVAPESDLEWFMRSGPESIQELERTLQLAGRSIESFGSILDFGCGCGRMLLWMEAFAAAAQLHGTDIDAPVIEWCRSNIPYASFQVNGADPPLDYPDGAFDLIFNRSVFTHLDERRQDLWLGELQRVCRPGGLLVLTTHGESAVPEGAWRLRDGMEREGIFFLDDAISRELGYPDWYQNTWHAPWYVFEHWARWFKIRALIPGGALGGQDQILLERVPDGELRAPIAARRAAPLSGAPAVRVTDALAAARRDRTGPPSVASLARRVLLRALRPYTYHEDYFDEAVVRSITELSEQVDRQAAALQTLSRDEAGADT